MSILNQSAEFLINNGSITSDTEVKNEIFNPKIRILTCFYNGFEYTVIINKDTNDVIQITSLPVYSREISPDLDFQAPNNPQAKTL